MTITPSVCPECGEPVLGTCDTIPGCALVEVDEETGEFEYTGETKVFWDGQMTEEDSKGHAVVQCHAGHQWAAEIED